MLVTMVHKHPQVLTGLYFYGERYVSEISLIGESLPASFQSSSKPSKCKWYMCILGRSFWRNGRQVPRALYRFIFFSETLITEIDPNGAVYCRRNGDEEDERPNSRADDAFVKYLTEIMGHPMKSTGKKCKKWEIR